MYTVLLVEAKDRSPNVVLVDGTSSHFIDDDDDYLRPGLRRRVQRQSSAKLSGARPLRHVWTRTANLNRICCLTGSQWSNCRTGVMCTVRREPPFHTPLLFRLICRVVSKIPLQRHNTLVANLLRTCWRHGQLS